MTVTALERVRALAERWAALEGDSMDAEVARRTGTILSAAAGDEGSTPEFRLAEVTRMAESWLTPGNPGLFYPSAGQCVLDAIKGDGIVPAAEVLKLIEAAIVIPEAFVQPDGGHRHGPKFTARAVVEALSEQGMVIAYREGAGS